MSGLVKAKKYDWKDSNLALFGTPLERDIKKAAAETEKAWQPVLETGAKLFIWRIQKFVPTPWPDDEAGKFFDGDSYIILNKYQDPESDKYLYDAHFWIGEHSSQDEYGTAAYKTVELDTFLDDAAIQHREVQGHESKLFLSYFKQLEIMKGGVESGFRHVEAKQYKPRLIQVVAAKRGRPAIAREVEFSKKSVNSDDVFVLDKGKELIQLNGETCNPMEKAKAMNYISKLKSDHGGASLTVIDQSVASPRELDQFFNELPDVDIDEQEEEEVAEGPNKLSSGEKCLKRLSDATGELQITDVASGSDIAYGMLDQDDVFFFDTGAELYVWVGTGASRDERQKAMQYGHNYLLTTSNQCRPVVCIKGGNEPKYFKDLF